ncbi:hypothetical protein DPMN_188411 [Dreissena polymorpha]|uniref:C-type lectin domain-containing protein n=1 Tax=Dreissena polymorpha TaxID=45954 RepID=A0A9D4IBB2_DREPO|nr:hypothetical protein DPMN_188411 [Dreissena polymorpha]
MIGVDSITNLADVINLLGDYTSWLGVRKFGSVCKWLSGTTLTTSVHEDDGGTCLTYWNGHLHDYPCNEPLDVAIVCDIPDSK